jgi:hypothetical protein
MLLSKKVFLKRKGNKNVNYYKELGYDVNSDVFEVNITDLTKYSNVEVIAKCDFCGKVISVRYDLYLKNISHYDLFACSKTCAKNKTIRTVMKKYGVENVNQSEDIKKKTKKTNLEKWGVEYVLQSDLVRNKIKKTNLEKWGTECVLLSDKIQEKSKETLMKNWGVDHNFKSATIREKSKETLMKNWGVDNPSKSEEILNRKKETSMKNWGFDNPAKSEEIKNKTKKTNLKNNGFEYPMQSDIIKEKSKKTLMKKYGVDHNSQIQEIKDMIKIHNLEKWGVEYTLQSDNIRNKIKDTNLLKYNCEVATQNEEIRLKYYIIAQDKNYIRYKGDEVSIMYCDLKNHEFEISSTIYHSRINSNTPLCTVCYPISNSRSIKESELFNFINSIYNKEIVQNYRDGLEIDIYLPDLKLGFEFNGLYWHSEEWKNKNYHKDKINYFKEKGIKIMHIWEDDWDYKNDIIKSQIRNNIGLTIEKIWARKCQVKEINDISTIKDFLNNNHIQGWVTSTIKLGLYYEDRLVAIMLFDHNEGRKKMNDSEWNLSRFCNIINNSVVGGASKLLNYFIKNYKPARIISYSDNDWSNGNLYYKLGFEFISEGSPDYKYIVGDKRVHKSRFRKSKIKAESISESAFMKNIGILKIWDCGKTKFSLIF